MAETLSRTDKLVSCEGYSEGELISLCRALEHELAAHNAGQDSGRGTLGGTPPICWPESTIPPHITVDGEYYVHGRNMELMRRLVRDMAQAEEDRLRASPASLSGADFAPSPLGGLAGVVAEYDHITATADPADPEWDFVMRASDYWTLRAALPGPKIASMADSQGDPRIGVESTLEFEPWGHLFYYVGPLGGYTVRTEGGTYNGSPPIGSQPIYTRKSEHPLFEPTPASCAAFAVQSEKPR